MTGGTTCGGLEDEERSVGKIQCYSLSHQYCPDVLIANVFAELQGRYLPEVSLEAY